MTKRKKQQLITVSIFVVVFLALGIGYYFADRYQRDREAQENAGTSTALFSVKAEDIVSLQYASQKAELILVKEEGDWKLEEDKDFPVEQSLVEEMVEEAVTVEANRLVTEECEDLAEYELEKPVLEISLTDKEGVEYHLAYGMESAAAEGSYAYTDSTSVVYIVPSDMTLYFDYTKNQLMELPETPDIDEDRVLSYTLEAKKGYRFQAKRISGTEEDAEEEEESEDTEEWDIQKSEGKVTDYDRDSMEEIAYYLTDLSFVEGVSYLATEKENKQYGLKEPEYTVTVEYYTLSGEDRENHICKLMVGVCDDTEENYYASVEGEEGIYLLPAEVVEVLVFYLTGEGE